MPAEDRRTTYTLTGELQDLIVELRRQGLIPRGEGLHKENAAVIWLATQHAKQLLAGAAAKRKR